MDYALNKLMFGEDATLLDAIKCCLAGAKKVGFCVGKDGRLRGMLTEGDILRAIGKGGNLGDAAHIHMNRNPVTVSENLSIAEAKRGIGNRIQILPRVDEHGRLIGYVDLATYEYGFLNIKSKTVTIVGLGYVGLTMGLVMADNGFSVNGWDIDGGLMSMLKEKKPPFFENGLQDYMDSHIGNRFRLPDSIESVHTDIFVVTVGTPIDKLSKEPEMGAIRSAALAIGRVLSKDNLVIIRSTVMVGTTRNVVIPVLEKASGLKAGLDFFVAFCPERTIEGLALRELRVLPQIVGGLDEKSLELASRVFNEYTPTIVRVESVEAAELCKLTDNCYRDVRFAFANQLAMVTERLGLNIHPLIDAVNLSYSRNSIPKPSPGVGGPCLTKDAYILKRTFEEHGLEASLLSAARSLNEMGPKNVVQNAERLLKKNGKTLHGSKVFVVGFAFKGDPETSDLRDSTTLWFLEEIRKYTEDIAGYDPVVSPMEIAATGVAVTTLEQGFEGADAVFIMNNHRSYANWNLEKNLTTMKNPALFYDCWHMFPRREVMHVPNIIYAGIGVGS